MSIGRGVVLAVAFQQIDNAPDTQTCAQGDYQGLQYADRALKKCHKCLFLLKKYLIYWFTLISYTSKLSAGFKTARCFLLYHSMSKTFLGSASAVYL